MTARCSRAVPRKRRFRRVPIARGESLVEVAATQRIVPAPRSLGRLPSATSVDRRASDEAPTLERIPRFRE